MMPQTPRWPAGIKRIALVTLLVVFAYTLYLARLLILPLVFAMVVAYIVLPLVQFLRRRLRMPRTIAIAVVYSVLVVALIAIPARVSTPLLRQLNFLISSIPFYLEQAITLANEPIELPIGRTLLVTDIVPLDRVVDYVVGYVPSVGLQSFNIFGSVASYTVTTVGWIVFILFISFYMVKDYEKVLRGLISIVPDAYEWEMYQLAYEISRLWNAFLRGQLILFTLMGSVVFTMATIIGLPNALLLGLIAGTVEFIPQIGPVIMLVPTVLVAFFQNDASWLGTQMSPVGFALLVGGGYLFLNQLASYLVVPRVLGRSLNMHPAVVFTAALAGAGIAGILGILVASPLLATGREIVRYIYCKLRDIPPYPDKIRPLLTAEVETAARPSAGDEESPLMPPPRSAPS